MTSTAVLAPDGAAIPPARRCRRAVAALLAGAALLVAVPAQDPTVPDTPGLTVQVEGDRVTISVNEVTGVPLKDFITLAHQITGRLFSYNEQELQGPQATSVSFVGPAPMRREDFFNFFQTILYIEGFACVLRGADPEIVEIIYMAGQKRQEISASARYVPPEEIENYAHQTGVTILTSVPLEYINANTATTALRPFFSSQGSTAGGLIPGSVGTNRALLLQGFGPSVYAAYQLLRLVDVPPDTADQDYRIHRLEHAAAEELEPILTQIMDERNRVVQQQAGVSGGDLTTGRPPELKIVALLSLNALVLSGSRDLINEALSLIAQLDVPLEDEDGDKHVIPLKNVLAEELHQTLDQFLQRDQQAQQQQQQQQAGGAAARRMRQTVIVPHEESNSLLVSASQSNFRAIERMIDDLDKKQPQVLIECALVELSTDDLSRFGVELAGLDIAESGDFTRPFGVTSFGLSSFTDTDDNGLPDTRLPDFDNPLQGITGGIISSGDFAIPILVNALATTQGANILSLPSVVVNNNEEATVSSQEERPTQTSNQGTATTSSGFGGFQGAGIELRISPSISPEDYLRLNIELQVSRFLSPFDPTSVTPGRKATRRISTQVTMPSGNTMILGGVIEDSESRSDSGIPILKDIPLLGFLFRTSSSQETKTNLYFFVTPTILYQQDFSDLSEISFRKKLEASEYIGHRRMQLVDRKWRGQTLEDGSTTIEDYDRWGGFEIPSRRRPAAAPKLDGRTPTGPDLPGDQEGPGAASGSGSSQGGQR